HQCAGDYGKNRRRSDNCWIAWEPEQADGVDRPMHQAAPISESEGERMALSAEMRPSDAHCRAQYSACLQQYCESHGGRIHLTLIKQLPALWKLLLSTKEEYYFTSRIAFLYFPASTIPEVA